VDGIRAAIKLYRQCAISSSDTTPGKNRVQAGVRDLAIKQEITYRELRIRTTEN
jgi:hypothetical protein